MRTGQTASNFEIPVHSKGLAIEACTAFGKASSAELLLSSRKATQMIGRYAPAAIALALLGVGSSSAHAQTAGDWILARYKGGAYWYPGVIQSIAGDRIVIAYDDGDRETTELSKVRPYSWAIGTKVECNFQGAGKWYPGTISSLAGDAIGIAYDDGDKERTKTGRCRSQ